MKLLICATLFLSTAAFACPDLSGTYVCKFNSNVSEKEFIKKENGFLVTSDGNSVEYVADGKSYEIPSTDSYKDASMKTTCTSNEMIVDFNATILYDGTVIGKQVSKSIYSMKGDNLIIDQKNKMKGFPLPKVLWTCTRK